MAKKKKQFSSDREVFLKLISRVKPKGVLEAIQPGLVQGFLSPDSDSGAGKPKESPPMKYVEKERKEAETLDPEFWKDGPDWLKKQLNCEEEHNYAETFEMMLKSLREKPSEKNLRLAQKVLNEIGRFKEGGKFLTKEITQKLLDEFQAKEGRK
jgi:hypothetical protein